ncbi:MAG: right-handed parallel beta-helix repeat-containing protein, partial [Elusimicrobiota bacterium]
MDTVSYPGCVVTKNVGAGQAYATISAAVAALPATLTGHSCVVIRDGATYAEQVTVQGFTNNGSSITIMADVGVRPTVAPPAASTAAFRIANSSVNIFGIDAVVSQNVPYGVWASSGYVQISSVNVSTSGSSGIYTAGIRISSWTTVSYSSVTAWNAHGLWLDSTAQKDTVSYSTFQANSASFYALFVDAASTNTFTAVLASNPAGYGARLTAGADYNTISQSTMTSNAAGYSALYLRSSFNTITQSYIANPAGIGAALGSGADYNTISQSTMATNAAGSNFALHLYFASSNTITQSYIANPAGTGAYLETSSNHNTIIRSTMTSAAANRYALYITASSSNTILDSYVQGSTAAFISGSTGTVIGGTVLVATNTAGSALQLGGGSVNLTLSSSSLSAPSGGAGLYLDEGNNGNIVLATNTITGARYGMIITTQAVGASLSVTSMTFSNLASGATAVNFTGGAIISTFTTASFDASCAVNVNGSPLSLASRITMRSDSGARTGAAYENDPNGLVDWDLLPAPPLAGPANGATVSTSAPVMLWGGTGGFRLQLSLDAGFTQVTADSTTANAYY